MPDDPPLPCLPVETLHALQATLRRAVVELEQTAAQRRAHAAWVRDRWRGRRRDEFDVALDELDGWSRRLLADLRLASARTAAQLDGGR